MPRTSRFLAVIAASGALVGGLATVAQALPAVPAVPTGSSGGVSAQDTPSSTASATSSPTATATATASPTATATSTATPSPSPKPTPVPTGTAIPWGGTVDSEGLFTLPRPKCLQYSDAAGDAATNPVSGVAGDPDDDLDLTGVVFRTSAQELQVYVKETALDKAPSSLGGLWFDTHKFSTGFTIDGRAVTLSAGDTGPAPVTVAGVLLHATATFDTAHSLIVFAVPLNDLAILVGHSALNSRLTALTAQSNASSSNGGPGFVADKGAPTKAKDMTYVVGDNTCFLPQPTAITVNVTKAVYTDLTTVTGTLADDGDNVLVGAPVLISAPGQASHLVLTNDDGVASYTFRNKLPEGVWNTSMSFAGTRIYAPSFSAGAFQVYREHTVLKALAGDHFVLAVLTDDEHTPLAHKPVAFVTNGKRHIVVTDSKGHATLGRLHKGQEVQVSFAGVGRLYYSAKKVVTKAN